VAAVIDAAAYKELFKDKALLKLIEWLKEQNIWILISTKKLESLYKDLVPRTSLRILLGVISSYKIRYRTISEEQEKRALKRLENLYELLYESLRTRKHEKKSAHEDA